MKRFSRLFWFTVLAGTVSSVLLSCAALWFVKSHAAEMVAVCRPGKDGCASWESLQHLFRVAFIAQASGTLLSFGLVYHMGRRFIPPAPQAAKDAGQ